MFQFWKLHRYYSPDPTDGGGGGGGDPEPETDENDKPYSIVEDGEKTKIVLPDGFFTADEKKEHGPEGDTSDNPDDSNGDFPPEAGLKFQKKYAGKTAKELLKVIYDQEQFQGRQATELGNEKNKNKPLTAEQMQTALTKTNKALDDARDQLDQLDPIGDKADYEAQKAKINELRQTRDTLTKDLPDRLRHELNNPVTEEKTVKVSNAVRDKYKSEFKAEFKDRDWGEIVSEAARISDGENVTEDDLHAAVLVSLGAETYHKMLMGQANFKTRSEIAKAQGMTVKTIGEGMKGKGGNAFDISELTNEQIIRLVNNPDTPYAVKQKLYKLRQK